MSRLIDADALIETEAIECIAWMPLPEPYREGEQE